MLKILAVGTINVDIFAVELEKIAEPGEVVYLDQGIKAHIGGFPVDVGINLVKLGFNPQEIGVIAAVGKGLFGSYIQSIIRHYKIRTFLQQTTKTDSGKNIALEKKGEDRRFHVDPGASWYLSSKLVREKIKELSPKVFCVRPGYCGIDLNLEEIFQEVKARSCFLLLDLMQFHPKRPKGLLLPLFHYADAIHCNQKEVMVNTGKSSPDEAIEEVLKRGAKAIFLTKGQRGAELITSEVRITQPSFNVNAIDATGAGDAFCAGVIYKLFELGALSDLRKLSHDKLVELLMVGQAVGSACVTEVGCLEGVSKATVNKIMKEQKHRLLEGTKVVLNFQD
jgi:sugar/nucleoside kinase (ribokinase family)